MISENQAAKIYDTLLCIPGMNEQVKLDLKISRKLVLLLAQVIERGLRTEAGSPTGLLTVAKEAADDLNQIAKDCLDKAGLIELSGKLKALES